MKSRKLVAAVMLGAIVTLAGVASAGAQPTKTASGAKAVVTGNVTIGDSGHTASFDARYQCPDGADWHLWVSVKQMANGRPSNALKGEGSGFGGVADTWLQSHPESGITCDGQWHTGTFSVNQTEIDPDSGQPVGYGTLIPGQAYVQFCLTAPDFSWSAWDMQFRHVTG